MDVIECMRHTICKTANIFYLVAIIDAHVAIMGN